MSSDLQNTAVMDEALLVKALEDVRARIADTEQHRRELDKSLSTAREEEQLLARLLALKRARQSSQNEVQAPNVSEVNATSTSNSQLTGADQKHPSVEGAVRELAEAGRPIHISELMRLLKERNTPIPGAGAQANLIAHLRRDRRIVRPSRGMYGLATWGLENMEAKTSKRRKKRRIRSKALA